MNCSSTTITETFICGLEATPEKYMSQLMTVDGITFACLGETAMAHGSSIKMEHCTGTARVLRGGTVLEQEVP